MKKIAQPFSFFSLSHPFKNIKPVSRLVLLMLVINLFAMPCYAQQVIGSFPTMDGGFEGQAVTGLTLPLGPGNYANGATVSTFSRNSNNTSTICAFIRASGGNSSPKCISWTNNSTSSELFTPTATTDAVASNTSYIVQFFAKQDTSDKSRKFKVKVSVNGNTFGPEVSTTQAGSLSYQKFTAIVTSGTLVATGKTGYISIKPEGGGFNNLNYLLDDFCMYAGSAVDNTAPDEVISPSVTAYTSTSLNLAWSAPGTGVDGGGYVVIRYAANPVGEPAPIANGIYAVGNTVGTGTIVSIGTGTSFNNTGLTANTAYYYRIYVADKAFNYSPTPITVAGYTGTAGPTAVTFTTPATCLTDRVTISWTGPLNYNSTNNTLLGFIKTGSAITIGTPTNALATYTASTNFAAPGTAYQNDANAYCIIKGDGTNSAGDHSGLTITGLAPGTTYHVLLFNVVNATTSYSAGSPGNGTTLTATAEPANNPTVFAKGAVTTSNIPLTWVGATGSPAPTGYLIKASNAATPADPADFIDPADQLSILSGSANGKTAAITYSSFTGMSAGTMYYFRINSYTNAGSCINYKAAGPILNAATLPNAVTSQTLSITGGTGTINWTTAIGYSNSNHTTLVFVSSIPIPTGTPTVNPASYTANTAFGVGTVFQLDLSNNARCVYNGDGSSAAVTGLISGSTYYVLILTVMSAANSDATYSYSAFATTNTTYSSASEYIWNGSISTDFQVAGNWTPSRAAITTADVLIYNTAGAVTSTNVPATQQIAKLAINTGNVTLQSGGAAVLTITNTDIVANINDFIVAAGASLTLGSTVSVTLGTSSIAYIAGTLNVNSGNTYNTNGTSVATTVAGTLNNYGTVTSATATKFIVNNEGVYNHGINGGTVPTGTWNFNSTCLITGATSAQNMNGHGQTYSKFIWDCPSQNHFFVLGENINKTSGPYVVITDSFIVKRTGGISEPNNILQLTSSGGQNNLTCGNYFQYGGIVAVTYNTDGGGLERSLTTNNTFYVTDSLLSATKFQIINNPGGSNNINGRLYVKGSFEMHPTLSTSTLEATKGVANPSVAELWFSGSTSQFARFSTITGNVDFVTNHTSTGVTLGTDATANKFKLMRGTFFIAGNTLTIKDSVTYPSPGSGTIGGSATSNLTLNGIAGSLAFYNGYRTLKDFTQTAGSTASLGTELAIAPAGRDSLGIGAVLTANDNLILRSDATGSARIAQIPTSGGVAQATITDKVTVERHLPMNLSSDSRRWRLLCAPFKTTNAPTIQAAWQEGTFCLDRFNPAAYDPKPGYGTHITVSTTAANGFDQGSTNNPSIFHYSKAVASNWKAPASTTGIKVTDSLGVYMLFVRGDRSILISNTSVAAKPTTLDPKGELNLGDVTVAMDASSFKPIGNPYASQIKLDNIDFGGTLGKSKTIYIWDPKALGSTGVGAFITCSGDGGSPASYMYTGNSSNYGSVPGVIESSGAFMVGPASGNIIFHETDKTIKSSTIGVASRPVAEKSISHSLGKISKLYIDLIGTRNGEPSLADGIGFAYNGHYKNKIDEMDAAKLLTFSTKERISIQKEEGLFSIERRKAINEKDTIQLYLSKLNTATYRLDFRPNDFDDEFTAYIEDRFTHTSTPVLLTENSSFGFDITNDSLSFATNRLFITFKRNRPAAIKPSGIAVFPNPVTNGNIGIKIVGIPEGTYETRLVNNLGQVVYHNKVMLETEMNASAITLNKKVAKGIYRLEIISTGNRITTTNVMIQ